MGKRSGSKRKRDHDLAVTAYRVVQEATGQLEPATEEVSIPPVDKHTAAVALGRLGGLKGGKARAKKLTPEERSEMARIAAIARWRKKSS